MKGATKNGGRVVRLPVFNKKRACSRKLDMI
nr:MAG TPA: hypothetical protein [Caudoviricetes sp.]